MTSGRQHCRGAISSFTRVAPAFIVGVTVGVVAASGGRLGGFAKWVCDMWNKKVAPNERDAIDGPDGDATLHSDTAVGDVPENAPESCPGVESDTAGVSEACQGCPNQAICASGEAKKEDPAIAEIRTKLCHVKRKILVLSGKGGVGKSTVAAQIAWALQSHALEVGLLDIDICGPSIPKMTGCEKYDVHPSADGWSPVYVEENFAVMSIGFLLPDLDDAVIWRGPKKNGLIKQFLTDVLWGELDFLIVDTPPGTSDEHLSIITYMKAAGIDGAIVVTTPQEVALLDVRKEINFCKKTGIPVLGVVENMTGSVFEATTGGAEEMCRKMDVPFFGRLTLQKELFSACEQGKSIVAAFPSSRSAVEVKVLLHRLVSSVGISLPSSSSQFHSPDESPVATEKAEQAATACDAMDATTTMTSKNGDDTTTTTDNNNDSVRAAAVSVVVEQTGDTTATVVRPNEVSGGGEKRHEDDQAVTYL